MDSKNAIPISQFGSEQVGILFKTLVFQKLYPGKFLIPNPCPYDELSDEDVEAGKDALRQLMPLDTIVTDMWDYDIHFEESTFGEGTYFDIALGSDESAHSQAEHLKEDMLGWIQEFGMDYAQDQWTEEEFEQWVLSQCQDFILKWRSNVVRKFSCGQQGTAPLDPKQIVSSEELLMSQVVLQEAVARLLTEKGYSPRGIFRDGKGDGQGH